MPVTCCMCAGEAVKRGSRTIDPHGLMCGSCAYSFFSWKRSKKWLRTVD